MEPHDPRALQGHHGPGLLRFVLLLAAALAALAAATVGGAGLEPATAELVRVILWGLGGLCAAAALLLHLCRGARSAVRAGAALAAFTLSLLAIEGAGRCFRLDFSGRLRRFEETPIYYRQPIVPVGEAFYRRPGPAEWTGQVIRTFLAQIGVVEADYYADEESVTVRYDRDGFRNPPDLADWEIALAGDSFVELGYLPDEDLISSRLATALGVPVKNLGVSFTGPLSHTYYLREYGAAPSAKHAVLAFFEGNDLDDLKAERQRLHDPGKRRSRDPGAAAQTSFLGAIAGVLRGTAPDKGQSCLNAVYEAAGSSRPMTVYYTPPGRAGLEPTALRWLDEALAGWADAARDLGMRPWLLYLPCKHRVLKPFLRYLPAGWRIESVRAWQPTDLPAVIAQLCDRHGIRFVDPTPALTAEAAAGRPCYNLVWDTHVDAHGAAVIAAELARALTDGQPRDR